MNDRGDLDGRVALVAGADAGAGPAIATALAAAGARVAVSTAGGEATAPADRRFAADVRDADAAHDLVAAVTGHYGRLDIVVTVSPDASADEPTEVVTAHLLGPLFLAEAARGVMRDQDGGGTVVFVGASDGRRPRPGAAAFGAAQAGLVHLAQDLAAQWGPDVRVNSVSPGGGSADGAPPPVGRAGSDEDVAAAVGFLASPAAGYISGADLVVHGGGPPPAFLAAVATA